MALQNNVLTLLSSVIATGASSGIILRGRQHTFQAKGTTSAGSGSATILCQVSNTDVEADYITAGTITLTLGTTSTSDGFALDAAWKYFRAKVSAISGTDATVTVTIGSQGD